MWENHQIFLENDNIVFCRCVESKQLRLLIRFYVGWTKNLMRAICSKDCPFNSMGDNSKVRKIHFNSMRNAVINNGENHFLVKYLYHPFNYQSILIISEYLSLKCFFNWMKELEDVIKFICNINNKSILSCQIFIG
jgi:hypothetical protein